MFERRRTTLRNGSWFEVNGRFGFASLDALERRLFSALIDAIADYEKERKFMILKAGTIVHIGGIPVELSRDAEIFTHPANEPLILREIEEQAKPRVTTGIGEAQGAAT